MNSSVTLTITENSTPANLAVTEESYQVVLRIEDAKGKSAYEIWLDAGHAGSEQDFLASLSAPVSLLQGNRIQRLGDGLYVTDDLSPDPLIHYILAKG